MHITMVKKLNKDGSPCRKCADVLNQLEASKLLHRIDSIVVADERDPNSAGMLLAKKHQLTLAPFFIVEDDQATHIYTVYLKFVKEVFAQEVTELQEIKEIMSNHSDIDLI